LVPGAHTGERGEIDGIALACCSARASAQSIGPRVREQLVESDACAAVAPRAASGGWAPL